jgi:ABC-type nitrate/sulfonate/bicarbonate transport system substrate-binding protein
LHYLAAQAGWPSINTVSLQSTTATITAVISGQLTATLVDYASLSTFIGTGLIKVIQNVSNPLAPAIVMATTTSFLQAHPDAVRAAVAAINRADVTFDSNATFAQNFIVSAIPSIPLVGAQNLVSVLTFSTNGALSISVLQTTVNIMLTYKSITTNITASNLVTQGYDPITP